MSVCLSVRTDMLGTICPIFTRLSVHAARDSVLLWRRCDMLHTSGFVDDVIFSRNAKAVGRVITSAVYIHQNQRIAAASRRSVVRELTPLLRCVRPVNSRSAGRAVVG